MAESLAKYVGTLDTKSIINAVQYLIMHPAEAEQMGRSGCMVEEKYNWFVEERKLLELYERVVKLKLIQYRPCSTGFVKVIDGRADSKGIILPKTILTLITRG